MKVKPGIELVREIAESGKYKMVPVSCEMLSDILTPIEALRILKNVSTHCYLLESVAEQEKWGRYTFLGFDPKLEITCLNGEMKAGNIRFKTNNPSDYCGRSLRTAKALALTISPPLPEAWSVTSPLTTWHTVSRP